MARENIQNIALIPTVAENGSGIPSIIYNIQIPMPNMELYAAELQRKTESMEKQIADLTQNMQNMAAFIMDKMTGTSNSANISDSPIAPVHQCADEDDFEKQFLEWSGNMRNLANEICLKSPNFRNKAGVYVHVYECMRKQYGIVWEQMQKERKAELDMERMPKKIEVCFANPVTRSIFANKLEDMVWKLNHGLDASEDNTESSFVTLGDLIPEQKMQEITQALRVPMETQRAREKEIQDLVEPLLIQFQDTSVHGVCTYRKIYKAMEQLHGVVWKEKESQYVITYGKKPFKKIKMVVAADELYEIMKQVILTWTVHK